MTLGASTPADFVAADGASMAAALFSGVHQRDNFGRITELFDTTTMLPSSRGFTFPSGAPLRLPASFESASGHLDTETFLASTETAALIVVHNGVLRVERYGSTGAATAPWLSMSVAKSFVSTLVGIALAEGNISSLDDSIDQYVPEAIGSAYEGVRIKDVLQMSSGAAWNEDYSDPTSDVRRLGRAFGGRGTLAELVSGVSNECTPGTRNKYNSAETQVLGFLVARATGHTLASYMSSRLWEPLGMTQPGHWIVDPTGIELAFAGLSATALDYAKLGELFRNGGLWRGEQLVPAAWVHDATTPDAPHLMPGRSDDPDFAMGYGYQWWIPDGDEGEFTAIGVYNQFVYVNPTFDTVIVKLSANPSYGVEDNEAHNHELATIDLFRAIARTTAL